MLTYASQARRQEMKWGCFVKKWKMGVFFCKKSGPFLSAWCIMYSISIFYFTFYLFGEGEECIRTLRTPGDPPCLRTCFRLFSPPVNRIMIHDAVLKSTRLRIGRLTSKTASNQNGHRPKRPQSDHKAILLFSHSLEHTMQ